MSESKYILKILAWSHILLGPLGVWIIMDDANHPERWDVWYRNPAIAIPFCLLLEVFLWGSLICDLRKQSRMEKGLLLLRKAMELQARGRHQEAEQAYQEGCRLTGRNPN